MENRIVPTGTWTEVANRPPGFLGTMLLLPNGTIMAQKAGVTNTWYQLTPDSTGSYVNGTWTTLASMSTTREYYGSAVLPSDNVMVYGGEYTVSGSTTPSDNSSREMYNIASNTWTAVQTIPTSLDSTNEFGDDSLQLLPNGTVLAGYLNGSQTFIYNPTSNSWSAGATKLNGGSGVSVSGYVETSDEEGLVKLPGTAANILDYELWASVGQTLGSAEYLNNSLTTPQWVGTGSVPVPLTNSNEYEMGPAILLPNGEVFQIGANGTFGGTSTNTALYNPSTNSWTAGPTIPNTMTADDAAAAILPDGNVIFAADSSAETSSATDYQPPSAIFEYNPTADTITQLTLPTGLANEISTSTFFPSYVTRMLVLPTGQVALADDWGDLWFYSESGSPDSSWQPTISNVSQVSGNNYTLSGTQLNGISEGSSYGDDAQMATNYPIVQITDSTGAVFYATTSNWTYPGTVATGSTPESTDFTLPSGVAPGNLSVEVIASGIASAPYTYTPPSLSLLTVSVAPTSIPTGGMATLTP